MEQGFVEFREDEIDLGMNYAEDKLKVRLVRSTLRVAGNQAGAIRKERGCEPRVAMTTALQKFCFRNRLTITTTYFNAYIRAFATMLNGRNPVVKAKRERDREIAEIKSAS